MNDEYEYKYAKDGCNFHCGRDWVGGWDGCWRPPGSSGLQFCVRVRARAVIGPVIRAQVEGSDCRMGSRDE